jgi:hypothetical protein
MKDTKKEVSICKLEFHKKTSSKNLSSDIQTLKKNRL